MADLTTLDPTQPLDTELASLGASRIREERAGIIGFAALEHALTGAHAFLVGPTSSRPAAGTAGRIFINTEHGALEWDTGAAWALLAGVAVYLVDSVTPHLLGAAPINILTQNYLSANSFSVLFTMIRVLNATAINQTLSITMGVDGVVNPARAADPFLVPAGNHTVTSWGLNLSLEGAHTAGVTVSSAPGNLQHLFSQLLLLVL